jgi:hypothetical protein
VKGREILELLTREAILERFMKAKEKKEKYFLFYF